MQNFRKDSSSLGAHPSTDATEHVKEICCHHCDSFLTAVATPLSSIYVVAKQIAKYQEKEEAGGGGGGSKKHFSMSNGWRLWRNILVQITAQTRDHVKALEERQQNGDGLWRQDDDDGSAEDDRRCSGRIWLDGQEHLPACSQAESSLEQMHSVRGNSSLILMNV